MITKHKLVFDPAASDDYDVVKSFLSASDGTLITHTGGALDVNIATSDIQLEVDLVHTEDSVRLGDGTSFFTSTSENGDIALDVHLSNTEISVIQGSDSPWTIDATDLDIRDLTHASDSVKIGDGTDFLAVESDGSINTNSKIDGYDSCNYEAKAVAITATDLLTTELSGRKSITLQNTGGKDIYVGCDASVTTSNGLLVPKGATAEFPLSDSINVHAIADGGASEFRILELA